MFDFLCAYSNEAMRRLAFQHTHFNIIAKYMGIQYKFFLELGALELGAWSLELVSVTRSSHRSEDSMFCMKAGTSVVCHLRILSLSSEK